MNKNVESVKKVVVALPGNYLFMFSVVLLILKASGHVDMPWWVVVSPVLFPYALVIGFPLLLMAIAAAATIFLYVLYAIICVAEVVWDWIEDIFSKMRRS